MNLDTHSALRRALRIDAIGCGIFAAAVIYLLMDTPAFVSQLDVSKELLIAAGAIALIGSPLLWSMSHRSRIRSLSIWILLMSNAAWGLLSCCAVFAGWISPSPFGAIVIVAQGIIIGAIAVSEYLGLRRAGAAMTS